jgi:AcrR family transcriptional regulator
MGTMIHDSPASRRERDRALHRREVLRCAEQLLVGKRYGAIRVQEVAAASGLSVGYLYRLFAGKEEIFAAVLEEKGARFRELLAESLGARLSVSERFPLLVRRVLDWAAANSATAAFCLEEMPPLAGTPSPLARALAQSQADSRARLDTFFAEAIRERFLDAADPAVIRVTFLALIQGYIREDLARRRPPQEWRRHGPVVAQTIVRAFAPAGIWPGRPPGPLPPGP